MKKRFLFIFLMAALLAGLPFVLSAGATEPVGFDVTCDGATGLGDVPEGKTYGYWVPILYRVAVPAGDRLLRVEFRSAAQLSRVEIDY